MHWAKNVIYYKKNWKMGVFPVSVDKLQEKIRKLKNPSVVIFAPEQVHIPPAFREEEGALGRYCKALLTALKGTVPAVRFSLGAFSLLGPEGTALLMELLAFAKRQEYYVLLDAPEALSAQASQAAARRLLDPEGPWTFDALVVSAYIGSDGLRPYVQALPDSGKAVFAVVRTANRTAPEIQDLLTGTRLVHTALADTVGRMGEPLPGRCGYSQVAAVAAASSPDSLRTLRAKYKGLFLLLDGYDYPNANAKNCSYAFDRLGHGAAACAGESITAAWAEEGAEGDPVELAILAAERMKKNLTRYVTVL